MGRRKSRAVKKGEGLERETTRGGEARREKWELEKRRMGLRENGERGRRKGRGEGEG